MSKDEAPEIADLNTKSAILTPRKIIVQIIGWVIGVGLLIWIIKGAAEAGDWSKIRNANPWLVAALLGCTAISSLANGTTFWITIQPLRPIRLLDMQYLNIVANMLNYAPVRLGAVARVVYHMRVDHLNLLQIGAWFTMIASILFLGLGACLLATLVREQIDFIWFTIVLGQMVVGAAIARFVANHQLVVRYGRGLHQIFASHAGLWGAVVLRLIDLAAYTGRMAAALAILEIELGFSQTVILALVALAASLMPVGKVGFREFCVAAVASRLEMETEAIKGAWEQLALIESAGEAIFFIPLGAMLMLWFRKAILRKQPVGG